MCCAKDRGYLCWCWHLVSPQCCVLQLTMWDTDVSKRSIPTRIGRAICIMAWLMLGRWFETDRNITDGSSVLLDHPHDGMDGSRWWYDHEGKPDQAAWSCPSTKEMNLYPYGPCLWFMPTMVRFHFERNIDQWRLGFSPLAPAVVCGIYCILAHKFVHVFGIACSARSIHMWGIKIIIVSVGTAIASLWRCQKIKCHIDKT